LLNKFILLLQIIIVGVKWKWKKKGKKKGKKKRIEKKMFCKADYNYREKDKV